MTKVSFDIAQWYASLDPEVKGNILKGLAGAAVGGGTAATLSALTPQDRERKRGVLGPALLGALLGGGAAVGIPAGFKMLNRDGAFSFPGETAQPAGSKLLDKAVDSTVMQHPLAIGAGVGAGWKFRDSVRALGHGMSHTVADPVAPGAVANVRAPVIKRLKETLSGPNAKNFWDTAKDVHMRPTPRGRPGVLTGRGRLAMIPAAIAAGIIGDKYLKGQW